MRDATTMMVARLALRQYAQQMLTPESMLAYLQVCLAERAKPHLLQRVFLPAAWRPAFLWLADRNAVESVRRSFPLPLLVLIPLKSGQIFLSWDDVEIAKWTSRECNALLLQLIAGDIREAGVDTKNPNWNKYQVDSEAGIIHGNMYRGDDGQVYYYIGD